MSKIIAGLVLWILVIIVSIWVMMFGWGLEPKNWWWIIGGGVFAKVAIAIMEILSKKR